MDPGNDLRVAEIPAFRQLPGRQTLSLQQGAHTAVQKENVILCIIQNIHGVLL